MEDLLKDNFLPPPKITMEELYKSPIDGFNCCGEIIDFHKLGRNIYDKNNSLDKD